MPPPERIFLQTTESQEFDWTWAGERIFEGDAEYIRADLHPTYAQQAVVEAVLYLYSPSGTWIGEEARKHGEDPYPRLWRLLQLVVNAPRPTGTRWAPNEGLARELVSLMTGASIDEVTEPLSQLLLSLRHRQHEDVPGMVVTELEAWDWEGEEGG